MAAEQVRDRHPGTGSPRQPRTAAPGGPADPGQVRDSRRRLTATQVLNQHSRLVETLDDPALADITGALMFHHALHGGRGGLGDPFYPAADSAGFLAMLRAELAGARTYQIAGDMVADITAKADGPGGVVTLRESGMPSPAGFAWLDEPVTLSEPDGTRVASRAVTWGPRECQVRGARPALPLPGIRIAYWRRAGDTDDFWTPQMSAVWRSTVGEQYNLILQYSRVVPVGRPFRSDGGGRLAPGTGHAEWVQALWHALVSGVAAEERPGIKAHARERFRRSARSGRPEVTVVTVRPPDPEGLRVRGTGGRVPGPVEWACQWHVDGYSRHVSVPDSPHKAVPSEADSGACAECGNPVIEVKEHRKGPPGKPFRDRRRSTVRRLQR